MSNPFTKFSQLTFCAFHFLHDSETRDTITITTWFILTAGCACTVAVKFLGCPATFSVVTPCGCGVSLDTSQKMIHHNYPMELTAVAACRVKVRTYMGRERMKSDMTMTAADCRCSLHYKNTYSILPYSYYNSLPNIHLYYRVRALLECWPFELGYNYPLWM